MRIPSLAERPRFFETGKIKIGQKAMQERTGRDGTPWHAPEKLDHFIITKNTRSNKVNLDIDSEAMKVYGGDAGKPTELKIMLMFNPTMIRNGEGRVVDVDLSANFMSFLSFYASRSCACRMNEGGQTATRFSDGTKKLDAPRIEPCNPAECSDHPQNKGLPGKPARCKPTGILRCMLQDNPRVGGVYVFRTHSWNTIQNIDSSLRQLMAVTGGILAGIPLSLTLSPRQVRTIDDMTVVIYEANISYPGPVEALMELTKELADTRQRLGVDPKVIERECRGYLELLDESPEEQKEINEEYFPETLDGVPGFNGKPKTPTEASTEPPLAPTDEEGSPPASGPEEKVLALVKKHGISQQELAALKIRFTHGGLPAWSTIVDEIYLKYEVSVGVPKDETEANAEDLSAEQPGVLPGLSEPL